MRVLVTSGTSGIGRAVALKLGAAGHEVDVVGGPNLEKGQKLEQEFATLPGKIRFYPVDLSTIGAIKEFAKSYIEETDSLHVAFLNAGVPSEALQVTIDGLDRAFVVNYLHRFMLLILLNPLLLRSQGGILLNGSSAFATPIDFDPFVFGRKTGLNGVLQTSAANGFLGCWLNREYQTGVPCISYNPGVVKTETMKKAAHPLFHMLSSPFSLTPEEAADNIYHVLLNDLTEKNNGLFIDGRTQKKFGLTIRTRRDVFRMLCATSLNLSGLTQPSWDRGSSHSNWFGVLHKAVSKVRGSLHL